VEDIFVPEQYMDLSEIYLSDIAIIVAKKLFKFSLTVQPVCVDWTKTSDGFLNSVKKEFGYVGSMLSLLRGHYK
jgi:hypothetical protein